MGTFLPLLFRHSLERGSGKCPHQCHVKILQGPGKVRCLWDLGCISMFSSYSGNTCDPGILLLEAYILYSDRQITQLGLR